MTHEKPRHTVIGRVARLVTSVGFAVGASVLLLVAGSVAVGATTGTSAQWAGALASGIATGGGGVWVGTAARRRHGDRSRTAERTRASGSSDDLSG